MERRNFVLAVALLALPLLTAAPAFAGGPAETVAAETILAGGTPPDGSREALTVFLRKAEEAGHTSIWVPDRWRSFSPSLARNGLTAATGGSPWRQAGVGRDGKWGYERRFDRGG